MQVKCYNALEGKCFNPVSVTRCPSILADYRRKRLYDHFSEVCEGLKSQEVVYAEVTKNAKSSQENIHRRETKRGEEDSFQVGDLVLQKNIRQEERKGGKLDLDMVGPFKIMKPEGKTWCQRRERGLSRLTQTN